MAPAEIALEQIRRRVAVRSQPLDVRRRLFRRPPVFVVHVEQHLQRVGERLEIQVSHAAEERRTITAVVEPMLLLPSKEARCSGRDLVGHR